jgi:hypothetical protein
MASVTLVHPEDTLTVPVQHAIKKRSLFQNNPALTVTPYQVQSSLSLSLSIFQEFVAALERDAVKITDTNFTELSQLCEELGFAEFAAKLSKFHQRWEDSQEQQIGNPLSGMRSALLYESFQFVVNGAVIEE